jgi:hypothetical protein
MTDRITDFMDVEAAATQLQNAICSRQEYNFCVPLLFNLVNCFLL